MRYFAAIATATVLSLSSPMASAIEEPQYTVVRQYAGFEIREYAPYLVAEVLVAGPAEEAGNQGFRILAGYIFGKNQGERKISMTAPVAQTPAPARIEMTAPVTQAAADGGYFVQFTKESAVKSASAPRDQRRGSP